MLMMLMLDNANDANVKTNLLKVNTVLPVQFPGGGNGQILGWCRGLPHCPSRENPV